MSNNDLWCSKCKSQHHPMDCPLDSGSKLPEYSEWECYLFGSVSGIRFKPRKGDYPNAFWRFMQYICFGNRWVKDKELK